MAFTTSIGANIGLEHVAESDQTNPVIQPNFILRTKWDSPVNINASAGLEFIPTDTDGRLLLKLGVGPECKLLDAVSVAVKGTVGMGGFLYDNSSAAQQGLIRRTTTQALGVELVFNFDISGHISLIVAGGYAHLTGSANILGLGSFSLKPANVAQTNVGVYYQF